MLKNITKLCFSFKVVLFLIAPILYTKTSFSADYANCSSLEIEALASEDYLNFKYPSGHNIDSAIFKDLENSYDNFIARPGSSNRYLFVPLKVSTNFDSSIKIIGSTTENSNVLHCGFNIGEELLCDASKLYTSNSCEKSFIDTTTGSTVNINDCASYDKAIALNKNPCYPEQHICNKYKEDLGNKYFSVKYSSTKDGALSPEEEAMKSSFYIYVKNVIPGVNDADPSKNCNYDILQCSINFISDNPIYKNFIAFDTTKNINRKFISNVASGLNDDYMLFVYKTSCKLSDCKAYDINKDGKKINLLTSKAYYKYTRTKTNEINNDTLIHIYVKDINGNKIGKVCNKYLANCADIAGNLKPFYNNRPDGNREARKSAYKEDGDYNDVMEAELGFIGLTTTFKILNCLALNDKTSDIGYCSDINEDGTLKYPNGLDRSLGNMAPNCYLKSCIDLEIEEIIAINNADQGGSNKYCSEYYYLTNDYGFDYLYRQKPLYCSDLDSSKNLIFPDGINENKNNCYLKNCFSLTDQERLKVIEKKKKSTVMSDFLNKKQDEYLKSQKTEDNKISITNRDELYSFLGSVDKYRDLYCKTGIYFKNNYPFFENFDYFNLNIIPCYEFSDDQLGRLSSNRMVHFTDTLNEYSYKDSNYFCKSHFENSNTFTDERRNSSLFFLNTFVGSDESELVKNETVYNNIYKNITNKRLLTEAPRISDYSDLSLSSDASKSILKGDYGKKNLLYPVCDFVDNSILLYDTVINKISSYDVFDKSPVSSAITNFKMNANLSPNYDKCVSELETPSATSSEEDLLKYTNEINNCFNKNCKESGNEDANEYCNLEEDIKAFVVGCRNFLSYDVLTGDVIDCSLFSEYNSNDDPDDSLNYDITKAYMLKNYTENVFTSDDVATIVEACASTLPLAVTEDSVGIDGIDYKIKPFYNSSVHKDVDNFDKNLPNASEEIYIGCTSFKDPGKTSYFSKDVPYTLFGCLIPDYDSSYIARSYSSNTNEEIEFEEINTVNFLKSSTTEDSKKTIYNSPITYAVCSRFSTTNKNENDCGYREDSKYADACVKFSNDENYVNVFKDSFRQSSNLFRNSKPNFRFFRNIYARNEYVFRDFHTSLKCSATNTLQYKDTKQEALVALEGAGMALIAASAAASFAAGIFAAIVFAIVYAAVFCLNMALRANEIFLSLQNDLFRPNNYVIRDSYDENKIFYDGFLTEANITDNNNYVYRYYPRSEKIEEDIKNKLENSFNYIDGQVKQTFYGNTTEEDIIIKCKLFNLISITKDNNGYNYDISNLGDKLSGVKICSYKKEKETVEKCITEEQLACLKSYGVTFLNKFITDRDQSLRDFAMKKGYFLKYYEDGSQAGERWSTVDPDLNWLVYSKVYYNKDIRSRKEMLNDEECKLMLYGDSFGSLDKCRGFEYEGKFYTESQPTPKPLLTSPFFFYNLITPLNTPEFFNPTIVLKKYAENKNYDSSNTFNGILTEVTSVNDVVVNFFNPIFNYSYDFQSTVGDDRFKNSYENDNNYNSQIKEENNSSLPYILLYSSANIPTVRSYFFGLVKTYEKTQHNTYIPRVCLHNLSLIKKGDALNFETELEECENDTFSNEILKKYEIALNKRCVKKPKDYIFISIDSEVQCYDRQMPSLRDSFVMFPSYNMDFLNPVINVYLKSKNRDFNSVILNKEAYALKNLEDGSYDVKNIGENEAQAFGLNFERSYCSKAYYDYYNYMKLLKEERAKDSPNKSLISMYTKNISTIERKVIPDCYKLNGNEIEIIINEKEMKTIKETNNIETVIFKEVAKVKTNNEVYGGYSEICLSDYDIEDILAKFNLQNNIKNNSLGKVLTYRDLFDARVDRKCVLDNISRSKESCLVDKKVYILCPKEEEGGPNCKEVINMTDNNSVYVKEIDCTKYLGKTLDYVNSDNIKEFQACFKGGYNQYGIVYKKPTTDGGVPEPDYSCSCLTVTENSSYNVGLFEEREITPREFGLCVDIEKPIICPAVRYYDSNKTYVDNSLFLGCLDKECSNLVGDGVSIPSRYYEQHFWRTDEKILGRVPSVFYTPTLGNAEFPATIYCGADKEDNNTSHLCVDSNNGIVDGECIGYWRSSNLGVPTAICTAYEDGNKINYEYKIVNEELSCQRYYCENLGYNNIGEPIVDEKEIINNYYTYFTKNEVNSYSKIKETDYRSYEHYQEIDSNSIDTRGLSNGFASWVGPVPTNGDFANEVISQYCLSGFGPAGTNVSLYLSAPTADVAIDYNSVLRYPTVLNFYKKQQEYFDNNFTSTNGFLYPRRICNQLGEWETVDSIYSSTPKLIDENYNNLFFHNGENSYGNNNFWIGVFEKTSGNGIFQISDFPEEIRNNAHNVNLITQYAAKGYCERLVCRKLEVNDLSYNTYSKELVGGRYVDNDTGLKVWQHTGGAYWDRVSAPRNSSDILSENLYTSYNFSQNIYKVFSDFYGDIIEDSYKHLKKVYGICQTEFGYYNRGTELEVNNFMSQLDIVSNRYDKLKYYDATKVDPRNVDMDTENEEQVKPSRVCTSLGLWDGVTDPCYRSCEMLDIYHTNFSNNIYGNNITNSSIFVDNGDILSIDVTLGSTGKEQAREDRFNLLNLKSKDLDEAYGATGAVKRGDFVTGGAYWPRTLFTTKNQFKTETTGPKAGLKYIEVEGTCDSTYNDDGMNEIRTYVQYKDYNNVAVKPTRKCYEDGSWGPVEANSRCVLYKNCKTFTFTIKDLGTLINAYNSNMSLVEMNKIFSNMPFDDIGHGVCTDATTEFCNLITLEAKSTKFGDSYSENTIDQPSSGYNSVLNPKLLCNISDANLPEDYVGGWNLKNRDIGLYFIPKTCNASTPLYDLDRKNNESNIGQLSLVLSEFIKEVEFDANNNMTIIPKSDYTNFYCKQSLLQYLNSNNPIFTKNNKNETGDNVIIGSKKYGSYQRGFVCNNDRYYNDATGNKYYNKKIILNCDSSNKYYNLKKNGQSINNEVLGNQDFIYVKDCKPRTCTNNQYQSREWSSSNILGSKELGSNRNLNYTSTLECGNNSAFVIKTEHGDWANSFSEYNGLAAYGLYNSVTLKCTEHAEQGKINGQSVGIDHPDYFKYGDLDISVLFPNGSEQSIEFCSDIAKKKCKKFTKQELNNALIKNAKGFLSTYCVPMYCKHNNLSLKNGAIKELNSGGFDLTCKNLETINGVKVCKDYPFNKNVVIQSYDGDFKKYSLFFFYSSDINRPDIFNPSNLITMSQYDNGVNICPNGQDIYNEGVPNYTMYTYIKGLNGTNKQSEASTCFALLDNPESDAVNNKRTGSYIKKQNDSSNINLLINKVNSISVDSNTIKNNVVSHVVDKIFVNGNYINNDIIVKNEIAIKNLIYTYKTEIFNKIIEEINNSIVEGADTVSSVAMICSADASASNMIETSELEDPMITEFNNLLGNSTGKTYYRDSTGFYAGSYYIQENNNVNICKVSVVEEETINIDTNLSPVVFENSNSLVCCSGNGCPSSIGGELEYNGVKYLKSGFSCSNNDFIHIACDGTECSEVILEDGNTETYYEFIDSRNVKCYIDIEPYLSRFNNSDYDSIEAVKGNTTSGACTNILSLNDIITNADSYVKDKYSNIKNCNNIAENLCILVNKSKFEAKPVYISIKSILDKYKEEYNNKIPEIKEEIKEIISNDTSSISGYSNYYSYFNNKYVYEKLQSMNGSSEIKDGYSYVPEEKDYFSLFKIILEENIEIPEGTVYLVDFDTSSIILNITSSDGTTALYKKTIDGVSCSLYKIDSNEELYPVSASCSPLNADGTKTLNDAFNMFFNNKISNLTNTLKTKKRSIDSELTKCNNHYNTFRTNRNNATSSSKATLKSGFFMGMICTPNGWVVVDKPACKNRCSGDSGWTELHISGQLSKSTKVAVENLRHMQSIIFVITGKQRDTSTRPFTGETYFEFLCEDKNFKIINKIVKDDSSHFRKSRYGFLGFGVKGHTFVRFVCSDPVFAKNYWVETSYKQTNHSNLIFYPTNEWYGTGSSGGNRQVEECGPTIIKF